MGGSFFDDVPGIHDIAYGTGAPVLRRNLLNIRGAGATLADNPAVGETQLDIPIAPAGITTTQFFAFIAANNWKPGGGGIDLTAVNLLRLVPSQNSSITGLWPFYKPRLVLANAGTFTITLQHENTDSDADNRFLCPQLSPYQLLAGRSVELVRDNISQRWRVVL